MQQQAGESHAAVRERVVRVERLGRQVRSSLLSQCRCQWLIHLSQRHDGIDHDLITRLSERMSRSRAQQPSITRDAITNTRESEVRRVLRERRERERDRGLGIEL